MNLAKLAIRRPTFIVALLVSVLILGIVSLGKLSVRMFPDVEYPYILVVTAYPGAGGAEIEQLVTKPIEDALSGVAGLKHSGSVNQDGMSMVYGEFELSKNPDIAAQEVRDKICQIRFALPENIREPVVMKADINSLPLITLSLKSENMNSKELFDFANDVVSKDLTRVSGVSQVQIIGGVKREIHVNVDKEKLMEREINLTVLAARIMSNSLNIPAGKVNRGAEEIAFRTSGEFESIKQISNVVVNFWGNDKPVLVSDVARVEDSAEREISRARLDMRKDGKVVYESSLLLAVYRQAKGNDVAVSDGIKKKIAELNKSYKESGGRQELMIISDFARAVKMNLDDVKFTILEGIFLAVIVVYFFLGSWRSTLITVLAIPNSLIGAFVFMYIFGFSLNIVSLMSLALTVGLLIDDAIVVRENIFRHYEEGANPVKAAIDGTNEVTLAVIATTSAVVAVFLPVAFLSGIMGKFFKEFGLTVVFAMTISIIDALTIAPMLSAYIIPDHGEKAVPGESKNARFWKTVVKIFRKFTVDWFNVAFSFIEELYKNLISFIIREKFADIPMAFFGRNKKRFAVSWKFMTLFVAALVFLMTIFAAKKYIKATFMPASEWGEFNIVVTAKPGTSLEQMDKYSKQIEEIIMGDSDIELVSSSIGSCDMFTNLSNRASIYVKMIPNESSDRLIEKVVGLFDRKGNKPVSKIRTRTTSQMKDYIREVLNKKFSGELEFSIVGQSIGAGVESEFIMELSGDNVDILHDFADRLIERYKTIPCFVDVHSNYKIGKPEVQIRMDQKKMENLGVSSALVGSEIRAIVEGVSAGKYRENGVEYDIKVKFKDSQRDILENFGDIYISNINHKLVKLKNVAFTRKIYGPDRIYRKDRFRYVTVEGNVAVGGAMSEIQKEALRIFKEEKCNPKNSQKWKNIDYKLSGNAEDMDDMFKSITAACALSIIFIFIVLASLYESVVTPFTIMTALPLAIIGGIIALLLFKQPVDIFTMIGMIMLLGIVAKNSILLVDYIQQQMRSGLNIDESIVKAGAVRLRPILMTSFALIAGMFPTALGFGELGKFRRSMGIVIIGGIISSTVLTLIVVPAIFEYMDKFRRFLRQLAGRPEKRMIDCSEEQLKEKDL